MPDLNSTYNILNEPDGIERPVGKSEKSAEPTTYASVGPFEITRFEQSATWEIGLPNGEEVPLCLQGLWLSLHDARNAITKHLGATQRAVA